MAGIPEFTSASNDRRRPCVPAATDSGDDDDGEEQHDQAGEPVIDLNSATAEELDDLPQLRGHGFEIVRYREERGRFTALRQLDEVPGLAGKADGLEGEVGLG